MIFYFLIFYLFLYLFIGLIYILFVFNFGNKMAMLIIFFILEVSFLFLELVLMFNNIREYFKDYHNYLDFLVIFLLLFLVFADFINSQNTFILTGHFFGSLLIGFRILLEIRIFKPFLHLT